MIPTTPQLNKLSFSTSGVHKTVNFPLGNDVISNAYLRPDGTSFYFQPDGESFYIQPQ